MWLVMRRATALAQLIGLPKAAMIIDSLEGSRESSSYNGDIKLCEQKADLWRAICIIDRIHGLLWSLPLATASYTLPKPLLADSHGQVDHKSYLYSMGSIASHINDLDTLCSSGRPLAEAFSAAVAVDQELRALIALNPKDWYKIQWTEISVDPLLQYWQVYFMVRTHLQFALKDEEGQDFMFSFVTCSNACQELARRYTYLRPIIPAGFFALGVIDLQVFTAAVFLLLSSYRPRATGQVIQIFDCDTSRQLVHDVVETMKVAADRAGGDFARHAADAIHSLNVLLQQPQTSEPQTITLNLALVGMIHVSRRPRSVPSVPLPHYPQQNQLSQNSWQAVSSGDNVSATQEMPSGANDFNQFDPISYSMELPENHLFFVDETCASDQWLTWAAGADTVMNTMAS